MEKSNSSILRPLKTMFCVVFCVLLFVVSLQHIWSTLLPHISVRHFLKGAQAEDIKLPAYVEFSTVHIGKNSINLQAVLSDNCTDAGVLDVNEVLFIRDGRIWFVYEEILNVSNELYWVIASVNCSGDDFLIHHSEVFGSTDNATLYRCRNNLNNGYFQDKSGFYCDGRITLTDQRKLIMYNVETGDVSSLLASEHVYPATSAKVVFLDDEIDFLLNDNTYQISMSAMSQSSRIHAMLMEKFGDRTTWNNHKLIEDYIWGVQTNGNAYYIVCNIMDWSGETYAVVYSFDPYSDKYSFCFSQYMGDQIHDGDFYIVPEYM